MKHPRDWTVGMALIALCAACVAVGALWLSWRAWPLGAAQAASWAVLTACCVWRANRNLRAELDAARRLLDAWNSSEARDELANSPAAGTPAVDPEPPEWMSQSGYRPPRTLVTGPDGEWIDISDSVVSMEITPGYDLNKDRAAWSALGLPDVEMSVAETDRLIANLQALPGTDDLGQLRARCGKPAAGAIGEAYLDPDGTEMTEVTWLCEQHYADRMAGDGE